MDQFYILNYCSWTHVVRDAWNDSNQILIMVTFGLQQFGCGDYFILGTFGVSLNFKMISTSLIKVSFIISFFKVYI